MVIPNVKNAYEKQRLIDEMPQSGTGRTVMTTEPKFIPADAAELQISGSLSLKVRMVDCVGYMIPGALGQMEDGVMRMVDTPWSDGKDPVRGSGGDRHGKSHPRAFDSRDRRYD